MENLKKLYILIFFALFLVGKSNAQTWEVYNSEMSLVSRLMYNEILVLGEAVRIAETNEGLFLLSNDYQPAVQIEGQEVYQYLSPWILVKGESGLGAYHEYGQKVLDLKYDQIEVFFNLLLAKKGQEYFVYERGKGTTRSLGVLDHAWISSRGQVIAEDNGKYYLPLSINPTKDYESLEDNDSDYLLIKDVEGYGLLNMEGRVVLDAVLDSLEHTRGNFYFGFNENQYLLVEGDPIQANVRYNSFHRISFENDLMLEFIHGKLRRVMKEDGILLDAVGMTEVNRIGPDLYNVKFRDNKLGLLGRDGWLVGPSDSLSIIRGSDEKLFPASNELGKWGAVDSNGQWIISPSLDEMGSFKNGIAAFRKGGFWGIIDRSGKILSDANWDRVSIQSNGRAIGENSSGKFILSADNEYKGVESFENIIPLDEGEFIAIRNGKAGFYSSNQDPKLENLFDSILVQDGRWLTAESDGKIGLFDRTGKNVLPVDYEDIIFDQFKNTILVKCTYKPIIVVEPMDPKKRKKGR
ncbi:WG repeat-containing protein [Algoriphagus sp. NF]|jgi:hypothetical protein|uniref:WG repeat-containing protein n=1 Tax=Algoriphagus sp. NF TaxID=2992756 RepID=UPI001066FFA8|nr:WG repeat-containing protein [Algoriphagus sp. NF]MDE0560039.1 WG repeat-containing protein [Algoriphagus sp. NF]